MREARSACRNRQSDIISMVKHAGEVADGKRLGRRLAGARAALGNIARATSTPKKNGR